MALRGSEDQWRKDSFDALRTVAALLAAGPDAGLVADYVAFLNLREKGLRKPSLTAADRFISAYRNDPFEIRQRICRHLIQQTEQYWQDWPEVDKWLFPGNLSRDLFASMFKEWRVREPRNANAWLYRLEWSFGLDAGEETAFMLEPTNPRCQYAELKSLHRSIDYCIHEFDHLGVVLVKPDVFSEEVRSLMIVTDAIGENLSAEVRPYLSWLQALSATYSAVGGGDDLRRELVRRSIGQCPSRYWSVKSWFNQLPDVLRG